MKKSTSVSTISGRKKIKIVLLGNQSVGKSSVIARYINNAFDEDEAPTVGIDYLAKTITLHNKLYRIQLWDTAGQERFRSFVSGYLRDVHCVLILFDVTCPTSLNNTSIWLNLYNQSKSFEGNVFLVANKIDLQRIISQEEGRKKAQEMGVQYFQISARTGSNIQAMFNSILTGGSFFKTNSSSVIENQVIKEVDQTEKDDKRIKIRTQTINKQCC